MDKVSETGSSNTKRYLAEDMRQALKQIRDELGPDAVILSNRRVNGGVEIIASVASDEELQTLLTPRQRDDFTDHLADDSVELSRVYNARGRVEQTESGGLEAKPDAVAPNVSQADARTQHHQEEPATVQTRVAEPQSVEQPFATTQSAAGQAQIDDTFANMMNQARQPVAAVSQANTELLNAMRSEIDSLRLLLKDQLEYNSEERWSMKNPLQAAVVKRLVGQGISGSLARQLADQQQAAETIEEAWQASLQALANALPILDKSPVGQQGVVALLGATGAGKTTTIAKLAVRYALKYGPDQLALVTTDSYRLAAYEELRTLGRIIDVPVRQVDQYNSLDDVLASLSHKSMVLIDTAGFHAGDKERMQQLQMLENAQVPIKKLLVLPSTSQSKVLSSMYELMASVHLDGAVLTKIDETSSLGEVLSLVVENRLPVAYITNGQKIPDDIGKACPDKLVQGLHGIHANAQYSGDAPLSTMRVPEQPAARQHARGGIL